VLNSWKLISPNKIDTPRTLGLDAFNIKAIIVNEKPNKIGVFIDRVLYGLGLKVQFFQNESYFAEHAMIIRDDLTLKNQMGEAALAIQVAIRNTSCPVSVHIRRGDYANNPKTRAFHGTCSSNYYWQAMTVILGEYSDASFFVFSDDMQWVKDNLTLPEQTLFVSDSTIKDYEELTLMSQCSHNIIANSTFSWWGAWLNPNPEKIVIAPKRWFAKRKENPSLPNWVKLDN
jgi:hypothetical protein